MATPGFAVVCALAVAACGDPSPGPAAATSDASSEAVAPSSAPRAATSAIPSSSAPAPATSGFAPPRGDLPNEERERELARILAGGSDARALPLADTEPGEEFEPRLRGALASRAEVRIAEPEAQGEGAPDLKLVHAALRGREAKLRLCYLGGLTANPNLIGRVGLAVVLSGAGRPTRVENAGSDIPDSAVVRCVVDEIGRIAFPAPSSGESRLTTSIMFVPP